MKKFRLLALLPALAAIVLAAAPAQADEVPVAQAHDIGTCGVLFPGWDLGSIQLGTAVNILNGVVGLTLNGSAEAGSGTAPTSCGGNGLPPLSLGSVWVSLS
ncbi:hypothetical protein [Nocardia stercoris]|uniref:Secreted protein n=1 Tax=Nocardia stercoris TaxID=2483361 RepID=A0A3M2LEM2_9NOCA|nr:hypothetical protein [Nocardia stercoris]RMI35230.1 hypothetical protein EBN03_02770 [Nocardia stercoris]